MSPEVQNAITLILMVAEQANVPLDTHRKVQVAAKVVVDALTPKPDIAPETSVAAT